jgi:hypothetical protein
MSDETRSQCLKELLADDLISRTPKGAGRSAEYNITDSGNRWLEDFLNSGGQELQEKVTQTLPIAIGCGSIEVSYTSDIPYLSKMDRVSELMQDRVFNRLVASFIRKEALRSSPDRISFTFEVKVDTEIPAEVRYLYHIVLRARRRMKRWARERQWLFKQFYGTGDLTDHDKLRLCLIDYFSYCPIAALEYTIIEDRTETDYTVRTGLWDLRNNVSQTASRTGYDSELYSFALAKWPSIPKSLRDRIRVLWNEGSSEYRYKDIKKGYTNNPSLSFTFGHPYPKEDDENERQTFYDPDWKLFLGGTDITHQRYPGTRLDVDFSQLNAVKHFNRALSSEATQRWLTHLCEATSQWVFGKDAAKPLHAIGALVAHDFLDADPILSIHKYVDDYERGDPKGSHLLSIRLALHQAVRNNSLSGLVERISQNRNRVIFDPASVGLNDEAWFSLWSKIRGEFFVPPSRELTRFRVNLPEITELPPFFRLVDRLWIRWVDAEKPQLRSRNIERILCKGGQLWYSAFDRDPHASEPDDFRFYETEQTERKRREIMSNIASKLGEFVNELEWEMP